MNYVNRKLFKRIVEVDSTSTELPIKDLPWLIENTKSVKILVGKLILYDPTEELLEELENRGVKFKVIK